MHKIKIWPMGLRGLIGLAALAMGFIAQSYAAESADVDRLVAALLGQTPLIQDRN